MVKLHTTPYKNDAAMGTFLQNRNGEKYFVHAAGNEGFTGYFLAGLTNGKGVALFVNSDDGHVLLELINSVALVYDWKGFRKPEQITTVPVNETLCSKYIGEYILDGWLSEIEKGKDGLYLWTDGITSKMYFTSTTDFRNIELGGTKTFTFDNAGKVTGYSNTINSRLRATGQKITNLDTLKPRPGQSGVLGRHLLETKNYDKAIDFLSQGIESQPSDSLLIRDLAHSYLFKGDFAKAIELYQQYLKRGHTGNELSESLKNDFEYFRKAGFDHSVIKKASGILSL
ncbi:tetratricopeptide repeat protein [Niastella yeongjuensis]|nr:tetratricopeptide repeat protein [Niastella yeongjuensis]